MSLLLDAIVKPSLVLVLALAAMPLLRNRSAALRHAVLAAALLCAAAVPLAGRLVPAWHVPLATALLGEPVKTPANDVVATETVIVPGGAEAQHGVARADAQAAPVPWPDVPRSLGVWIWLIGSIPGVAILIAGIRQLVRLAASARRIETGTWVTSAAAIGREYGFTRDVTLLEAPSSNLLITWGFVRPTVLLPAAARDWPEDRVAVVLAHELAHIRRGDWIVLLMAELLRAIYWFNPLFWVASALTRQESERACDDRVLNRGVPGSEYATHLVGIARALRQEGTWLPAPAIARTSSLEGRVKAMLDARLNRRPLTRTTGVLTLSALLAVTLAVAGFAPAQTAFASLSGSIVDPQNAALPGVTLVLTNLQNESKYEVKSNASGHYEFVGLPPGEYAASVKLPGFATVGFPVSMAGQNVRRDLKLQIGLLEETITVSDRSSGAGRPGEDSGFARNVRLNSSRRERRKAVRTARASPGRRSAATSGRR